MPQLLSCVVPRQRWLRLGLYEDRKGSYYYLQICPECGMSAGAEEETLSDGARLVM